MKLSACLTLHDRPYSVMQKVFDSMKKQNHNELVIVFDQTPVLLADYCLEYWKYDKRTVFVVAPERPPGWRSPVKAWNAAFKKATGDILYCFSSETVQADGNVGRTREAMKHWAEPAWPDGPKKQDPKWPVDPTPMVLYGSVSCSCGPQGQEVNWNGQAPGNLFCNAAHPRPLGFIWAAPAAAVKTIGGYDEAFADGFWYDDNDFFLRLWRTGLDFLFDDSISGTHLHHERPVLATPEGQEGTRRNTEIMLKKHGLLHPWDNLPKIEEKRQGRTTWRHP